VRLRTAGASAAGFPITECQIGHGKRHAEKLATVQLLTALYAMGYVQKP